MLQVNKSSQEVEQKEAENKHLKMSVQSLRNVSVSVPHNITKFVQQILLENLATGGDGGSAQYVIKYFSVTVDWL